jgi:3-oxoacyl-[acyl-carrier-protein] synthase II
VTPPDAPAVAARRAATAPGEPIAVSGLGAVSALGIGSQALWEAMAAGRDGLRPVRRFSTEGLSVHLAGLVPERETMPAGVELTVELAVLAAREALAQARLAAPAARPTRVGLVLGTCIAHRGAQLHEQTELIAATLGIDGPRITVSTACASSTNAFGVACDLLRRRGVDAVVAGGCDALNQETFAGFDALRALSPEKCAAFSYPEGTTLGEGAGFLVLEREADAWARGATILCWIAGCGLSADGHDATAPDPRGRGTARAVAAALAEAGLAPADIGYVNAHGTGTAANDRAEWLGLVRVFGAGAETLPVSSSKGLLGHAQGAAGALEAIATVLAMGRQVLPQTLHYRGQRPCSPPDPVAQRNPRAGAYDHALCTSAAFGGANAAVILSRTSPARPLAQRTRRRIAVAGVGVIGALGMDAKALGARLEAGDEIAGRVPAFRLEELVKGASSRAMDPSSRFLTAAAAEALRQGSRSLGGAAGDRTGLVLGVRQVSPESEIAYRDSIEPRGLAGLSARAFAQRVLNAPAGACSRLLGLRGPHSTVSSGPSSGLLAVAYAADLLANRPEADAMVAGGLHEHDPREPGSLDAEGAACLLLADWASEAAGSAARAVELVGWGVAGPGLLAEAVEQALDLAALTGAAIDRALLSRSDLAAVSGPAAVIDVRLPWLRSCITCRQGAARGVMALAAMVEWLRAGRLRGGLVACTGGQSAACALVLLARPDHTSRGVLRDGR